jgi:hypothetical protein
MSWAFLAGDFVYKVKKPVHFAFADAFILQQRYLLCREEVRLNRRLAPDVYLGVLPIIDEGSRYVLGDSAHVYHPLVREFAVQMRRLPDELMLDHQLKAGDIRPDAMSKIAARLAAFHGSAASAGSLRYGSPAAVERTVIGNLEESRTDIERLVGNRAYEVIANYLTGFIRAHRELLTERAYKGRVREGHGDLRCEHVCMSDKIEIIDCVEFDQALRYGDVASDVAFLAMDLDASGVPDLADEFIGAYAKETGGADLATLVTFYKCHRACVRGKVDCLKSLAPDIPPDERKTAGERALAKFALAARYAGRGRPSLLVVCGLIASGKSTVAEALRLRTGFEVFNSDRLRKQLASIPAEVHSRSDYGTGLYTPAFDRLTYDALLDRAHASLRKGRGVILDAAFKNPQFRKAALALANEMEVPAVFVECHATEEETIRRLNDRAQEGTGVSDATAEIYEVQKQEYVPLSEVPDSLHFVINAGEDFESAVQRIERTLATVFESQRKSLPPTGRN